MTVRSQARRARMCAHSRVFSVCRDVQRLYLDFIWIQFKITSVSLLALSLAVEVVFQWQLAMQPGGTYLATCYVQCTDGFRVRFQQLLSSNNIAVHVICYAVDGGEKTNFGSGSRGPNAAHGRQHKYPLHFLRCARTCSSSANDINFTHVKNFF